jgi:hypothetical protein
MKNQKILPSTHYYETSLEPCTHVRVTHTVDRNYLLATIAYHYYEVGKYNVKLTRAFIKDKMCSHLQTDGDNFFEVNYSREYLDKEEDYKNEIMAIAKDLFPDWFETQVVQYIID